MIRQWGLRIHFLHLTQFSPNIPFLVAGEGCVGIRTNWIDVKYIHSLKKKTQSLVLPSIRLVALWNVPFFERTGPHIRPHSRWLYRWTVSVFLKKTQLVRSADNSEKLLNCFHISFTERMGPQSPQGRADNPPGKKSSVGGDIQASL